MASEGRSFSPSLIENGWLNPDIMASLILEDGSVYRGKLFGAVKSVPGEVGKIFWTILELFGMKRAVNKISFSRFTRVYIFEIFKI